MNVYEKLQKIKLELLESNIKKSGENRFANFKYYELSDFLPYIIKLCDKYKASTFFDFYPDSAILHFVDIEKEDSKIVANSPVEKLEIRGSNAIQALGGTQTYIRRYLYMAMFDITENDTFDAVSGKEVKKYCCEDCGTEFKPFTDMKKNKWCSAKEAYEQVKKKYGKASCRECREKPKENDKNA